MDGARSVSNKYGSMDKFNIDSGGLKVSWAAIVAVLVVVVVGAGLFAMNIRQQATLVGDSSIDSMDEIHIMANGDVMLGNGEVVTDANITSDGKIVLSNGEVVAPVMDMRSAAAKSGQATDNHDHGMHSHEESAASDALYGPGMSPLHMVGFNADLAALGATLLEDFSTMNLVEDIVRNADDLPAPIDRNIPRTVKVTLEAKEVVAEIDDGIFYNYWTFNGQVPGPILRVREGDTVEVTLKNDSKSTHGHSIDFHAVTGPMGGGVISQTLPGESSTIRFKALKAGFYVYHCMGDANGNTAVHIANHMFGGVIVEPKGGLTPVDKEFVVFQGELYTTGEIADLGFQMFDPVSMMNETPDYYTINGKPRGLTGEHSLKVRVGETIRIFFGNMGNAKTSSFHVIGEIMDNVYREGDLISPPARNLQTTVVPVGGAMVAEITFEVPGTYVMVDHSLARLDRGAWGVIEVGGADNDEILFKVD